MTSNDYKLFRDFFEELRLWNVLFLRDQAAEHQSRCELLLYVILYVRLKADVSSPQRSLSTGLMPQRHLNIWGQKKASIQLLMTFSGICEWSHEMSIHLQLVMRGERLLDDSFKAKPESAYDKLRWALIHPKPHIQPNTHSMCRSEEYKEYSRFYTRILTLSFMSGADLSPVWCSSLVSCRMILGSFWSINEKLFCLCG